MTVSLPSNRPTDTRSTAHSNYPIPVFIDGVDGERGIKIAEARHIRCPNLDKIRVSLQAHRGADHEILNQVGGKHLQQRPGACLKGRALCGATQSSDKAVVAHCKIGWGGQSLAVGKAGGGGAGGLWTCLRVELKEERWEGKGVPPSLQAKPLRRPRTC